MHDVTVSEMDKNFSADQIDEHLWLGDIDSSKNHQALDNLNITHILTVLHFRPEVSKTDRRIRKYVEAFDISSADLLSQFEDCFHFIDNAVSKKQNVLIHCMAGASRSATIACAYLMKKYNISYETAIERLRNERPCVYPNEGFENQLRQYHKNQIRIKSEKSDDVLSNDTENSDSIEYKCKLCRHVLFTNSDLVQHTAGKGRFDHQSRSSAYKAKQNAESKDQNFCQQELFTNQPEWLNGIFDKDTNDGEIDCPNSKCGAKVGRYSLVGEKCTCAKWIDPAFHFHRSKIDECPKGKSQQIDELLLRKKNLSE